ncbi:MAG TPA: hypothetical protein PKM67_07045 [Kiritimatiellia bacterium]|nr:hypothetical protein [Kiritimatiellia bacterium]HPA78249.1 hypothetical protein [Kiritimatiellia bacterium]HQP25956.1 hypothetical protein [Smithellaceae bacterium]
MDYYKVIDILKWPCAALIACLIFRKAICSVLARIKSVGKDGVQVDPPKANDQSQTPPEVHEIKEDDGLMHAFNYPSLLDQEHAIVDDLKRLGYESTGKTISLLIRYLANAQITILFQNIYRLIFGSQIVFLKVLNQNRVDGLNQEYLEHYYSRVKSKHSPGFDRWNTKQYVEYLISSKLIRLDADRYYITNLGIDYLQWMINAGLSDVKPF